MLNDKDGCGKGSGTAWSMGQTELRKERTSTKGKTATTGRVTRQTRETHTAFGEQDQPGVPAFDAMLENWRANSRRDELELTFP